MIRTVRDVVVDDDPGRLVLVEFGRRRFGFVARESIDSSDRLIFRLLGAVSDGEVCAGGEAGDEALVAAVSCDDPGHCKRSCV